jgi:Mg-chelatase subunit ChlD
MRKYKGYEFREAITAFAHKAAKAVGVVLGGVRWVAGATTASINERHEMRLPDVRDDAVLTHVQLVKYTGYILHELMHGKFTQFDVWDDIPDRAVARGLDHQYTFKMWNGIEDAYIENRAIREGITGNVDDAMTAMADHVMQRAFDANIDWADPAQYPFVFAFALRKHGTLRPRIANGLQPIIDGAADRLAASQGTADNANTALWVVEQLAQLKPDQQDQPDSQDQPGDDGQSEDGGQPGDDGQPDGEGQPGDDNGAETDENGSGDANGDEPGDAQAPEDGDGERGLDPEISMDGVIEDDAQGTGHVFRDSEIMEEGRIGRVIYFEPIRTITHAANAGLRHQVRRLFENTATDGWSVKRKQGAINVSALPNIATGGDRLFKRRYESEGIDSVVMILLDTSGSMNEKIDANDRKTQRLMDVAAETVYTVGDALHRAGVRVGVTAFDHYLTPIAPLGVHPKKLRTLMERVSMGGSTCDLEALRWAQSMLVRCPEQRKMVIVLTDGDGAPRSDITDQVRVGRRLGVETLAIGINHDVSHYINAVTVNDVTQLGAATMKQLKLAA